MTYAKRKRQTEPGSVTFYDIRPGNGADVFFQPQSQHGAASRFICGQDQALVRGSSSC